MENDIRYSIFFTQEGKQRHIPVKARRVPLQGEIFDILSHPQYVVKSVRTVMREKSSSDIDSELLEELSIDVYLEPRQE